MSASVFQQGGEGRRAAIVATLLSPERDLFNEVKPRLPGAPGVRLKGGAAAPAQQHESKKEP
jgi:hypothetical protein